MKFSTTATIAVAAIAISGATATQSGLRATGLDADETTTKEESHLLRALKNGHHHGKGNNKHDEVDDDSDEPTEVIEEDEDVDDFFGVEYQTPEAARDEDIDVIAAENGWEREDTESHMVLQDAFKGLVAKLKGHNHFCESMMAEKPGASPKILFKGGVPKHLEAEIDSFESENNVKVDRVATKFSRKDQEKRAKRIQNQLKAKGFGEVPFAIIGDELQISAQKPADDRKIKPTPPGRGKIPPGQVDEVAADILELSHDDEDLIGLQLDIYPEDAKLGEPEHTRGGRKIYGGGYQCTTAFSVRQKSTGTTGILSAGHCGAGMNTFDAESSGLHNRPENDYGMTHKQTYMGLRGDFAWYTTPHWELPQYWASPTSMRDVTGWDFFPSVNEWVCNYSRMQGKRTCTQVHSIAVGTSWASNLVSVKSHVTTGGDSGGPWSWANTAYGVHSGVTTIGGIARSVYSEMYWLKSVFGGDIELLCTGTCEVKYGS